MPASRLLNQLTQVFLTNPCPLCQRSISSLPLCDSCHQQLLACQWLSSKTNHSTYRLFNQVTPSNSFTSPVFSWGKYQGVLKQVLALLKYGNQAELGFWLGCQLGQYWQSSLSQPMSKLLARQRPMVIPIPLHSQRLKQRGYNQAALIARGFCRITGLPLAEHGLMRVKATDAMHSLGLNERKANLTDAFQLGKDLPRKLRPILLIDDIYTTGTTVNAAAIPLLKAGHSIIGTASVAQAGLSLQSVESQKLDPYHQKPNLHPIL